MAEKSEKKDAQAEPSGEAEGLTLEGVGGAEEEHEEGAPRWMATFADLVTLLMCFFVLMFAMSSTQQDSFKELIQSLQSALGVSSVPEAGTREGLIMPDEEVELEEETEKPPSKSAAKKVEEKVQQEVDEIVSDVTELIMFNKLGGMVNVKQNEMGATITISDVVLFPPGESSMTGDGYSIMAKVAKVLAEFPYHIKIVGHTDNKPIHTPRHSSNWELSADRACEVVRFLIRNGMNPKKISAEGYAEYRPIANNSSSLGRSKNRRVEIIYERRDIVKTLTPGLTY